jgi:hypothetical protein
MAGRLLALLPEQWAAEMGRAEAAVRAAAGRVVAGQVKLTQVGCFPLRGPSWLA